MTNQYKVTLVILYLLISLGLVVLSVFNPVIILLALLGVVLLYAFLKFIKNEWGLFHYLAFLAILIPISPIIRLPGLPWGFRLDDFWLMFGALVFLIKLVVNKDINIKFPSYAKLYLVFILWISFTIFLSVFREPNLYSHRDWTELYTNGKALVVLLLAINTKLNKGKLKKLIDVILFGLFISAAMGVAQYFNFLNINTWLTPFYIFETNYENLINVGRVVGTFANPNTFGAAMLIGIAISFARILYKFNLKYLILLTVYLSALTLSLSRTNLLLAVLLLSLILIMVLFRTRRKVAALFMTLMTPVLLFFVLYIAPDRLFDRFREMENLATTGSWTVRLFIWENVFENRTMNNIFTGTGPTSNLRITFDNEWLMLLTHYGLIGVFLFLAIFITIYLKVGKAYNYGFYGIAIKSLMITLAGCMIFLPIYGALQLIPLIILALGVSLNNSIKAEEDVPAYNKKKSRKKYKIAWSN